MENQNSIREKRKKVIVDLVNDSLYVPMKEKELAVFLQVAKDYPFIIFRLMRWVSRISAPVAESISVHP